MIIHRPFKFFLVFFVYTIFSKKLNRYYVGTIDEFFKHLAEHNGFKCLIHYTSREIAWKSHLLIDAFHSEQVYQIEEHIKNMRSKKYIEN